jgi:hypothetical protein
VLTAKKLSRKTETVAGLRPASLSMFFVNGNSDSIKIVANAEGIQALRQELEMAERSVRKNKSYLVGDPLWLKGSSRIVSIEPILSKVKTLTGEEAESEEDRREIGPRIFWSGVILITTALIVIGAITVFQWLF